MFAFDVYMKRELQMKTNRKALQPLKEHLRIWEEVYSEWFNKDRNFCVNIGKRSMLTFNVYMIRELQMKTNQKALQPLYSWNSTFAFGFLQWKFISIFHIITEDPDQHVSSDRFTAQMSDDQR